MWLEHGYFSDRQDLSGTEAGRRYLDHHGLSEFEVVGELQLYHSPASLIEGTSLLMLMSHCFAKPGS